MGGPTALSGAAATGRAPNEKADEKSPRKFTRTHSRRWSKLVRDMAGMASLEIIDGEPAAEVEVAEVEVVE